MRQSDFYPTTPVDRQTFQRREPQISVRRSSQEGAFAFLWFFATAVTVVLSLSIARLLF